MANSMITDHLKQEFERFLIEHHNFLRVDTVSLHAWLGALERKAMETGKASFILSGWDTKSKRPETFNFAAIYAELANGDSASVYLSLNEQPRKAVRKLVQELLNQKEEPIVEIWSDQVDVSADDVIAVQADLLDEKDRLRSVFSISHVELEQIVEAYELASDWNDSAALANLRKQITALPQGLIEMDETGYPRIIANNKVEKENPMTNEVNEKKQGGIFITVPAKISASQESVRFYEVPGQGKDGTPLKLAEVTLPKGTRIGGEDASYYKFSVTANQLDPGGQKFPSTHSVLLPETNSKTSESWNVKLHRDFGKFDGDKNWVSDLKTINCSTKELQVSCKEQYQAYKAYREKQIQTNEQAQASSLTSEAKDARSAANKLGNNAQDQQPAVR